MRLGSLDGRGSIPIWSYLRCRYTLLLRADTDSGTGIVIAFTGWSALGMMKRDRMRCALTVVGAFPGTILCHYVTQLDAPLQQMPTASRLIQ